MVTLKYRGPRSIFIPITCPICKGEASVRSRAGPTTFTVYCKSIACRALLTKLVQEQRNEEARERMVKRCLVCLKEAVARSLCRQHYNSLYKQLRG